MRPLVLISALVAVCSARPEAPGGYNYPAPGAGGVIGGGGFSGGFSSGSIGHGGSGIGGFSAGGSGIGGFSAGGSGIGGFSAGGSGFSSGAGIGGGFSSGGFGGGVQVHKHVYVHVAPEEPEERRQQAPIQLAAPQKHYKIIFIKAPSAPAPTAPVIPVQPQNEEKTLVYVLVKKPEEQPDIVIPTAAPTQPSKPEVYFIKYKTQKDASGAIGAGLGGGSISGGGLGGGSISGGGLGGGSISGGGLGGGISGGSISGGGIDIGSSSLGGSFASSGSSGVSSKYGVPGARGY